MVHRLQFVKSLDIVEDCFAFSQHTLFLLFVDWRYIPQMSLPDIDRGMGKSSGERLDKEIYESLEEREESSVRSMHAMATRYSLALSNQHKS